MDCEDCENYKPKEDKEFQKMSERIKELIESFCCGRRCDKCALKNRDRDYSCNIIKNELRADGAKI